MPCSTLVPAASLWKSGEPDAAIAAPGGPEAVGTNGPVPLHPPGRTLDLTSTSTEEQS